MLSDQQREETYSQIEVAIDEIRERHNACTARSVAAELHQSPHKIRQRIVEMGKLTPPRVTWTDMPGSLTRVVPVAELLDEAKAELKATKPRKAPAKKASAAKRTAPDTNG